MTENALSKIEVGLIKDDRREISIPNGKRYLINEFDHLKNISIRWSIDRITIVGKLNDNVLYHLENGDIVNIDFEMLMRLNEDNGYLEAVRSRSRVLRDKWRENIAFIEILKYKGGYGRIDFNPNTIAPFLHDSMKNFIHDLFLNPHFSRADVACDIFNIDDNFISQYRVMEPIKFSPIYGRSGALETAYFGSSSSEKQVRMYNKLLEQTKKGKIVPTEIGSWWRVELQLRRAKATEWYDVVVDSLKNFASPHFFGPEVSTIDKLCCIALVENHHEWANLSRNYKRKLKDIMKSEAENNDLTIHMLASFIESASDLKKELDTWLLGIDVSEKDNYYIDSSEGDGYEN